MGHADDRTTQRYLHYRERGDEATRLPTAFSSRQSLAGSADAAEAQNEPARLDLVEALPAVHEAVVALD